MPPALRHLNYRLWLTGNLVANSGTWMQRVAHEWLVLTALTDHSAFAVGVAAALQFGPAILLAPIAGAAVDRVALRPLLIVTQGLQAATAAVLGVLVISGSVELWHVYAASLVIGVVIAVDNPARQAILPELVPTPSLPSAIALNGASFNLGRLLGPSASALVIAGSGIGTVFLVNAVSFAATILAVVLMRRRELVPREPSLERRGMRAALPHLRVPWVLADLVLVAVVTTFAMGFQVLLPVLVSGELEGDAGAYGLAASAVACGSLLGAVVVSRLGLPRARLTVGVAIALGACVMVLATLSDVVAVVAVCVPIGATALMFTTSVSSRLLSRTVPAFRGRVMAVYLAVLMGATALSGLVAGALAEVGGIRVALGLCGAVAVAGVAVVATLGFKRSRQAR
jgi:MFS family permease